MPWTYVINDPNGGEIVGTFYKKVFQKKNQKEFRIEIVVRKKGDKIYAKWKGYNSSNSWIDKRRHSINKWIFCKTVIFSSKCENCIRFV